MMCCYCWSSAIDSLRHRRVHPAFLWGTIFLVSVQTFSTWLAGTAAWEHIARVDPRRILLGKADASPLRAASRHGRRPAVIPDLVHNWLPAIAE